MKKEIFILAALFSISCGKKEGTSGNSDQNNVANVQDPDQSKIMSDEEYLKSLAINYSGSDLYGKGLNCSKNNNDNFVNCEYNKKFNQESDYHIELSAKGIFRINKLKVNRKYECEDFQECNEKSKYNYNCKISYKETISNTEYEMCNIYGIDYGFISNLNSNTIYLKSERSYYSFIFSKNI